MNSYSIFLFLWEKFNLFCKYTVFLFIYKLTQRYFAFLTQKGAMPQVLGLLRAWLYSICRFVQPRPDGCLSRIKRQSNTAYSIVQPWLDDRVSLICLYKLPDSWRRRQVGHPFFCTDKTRKCSHIALHFCMDCWRQEICQSSLCSHQPKRLFWQV